MNKIPLHFGLLSFPLSLFPFTFCFRDLVFFAIAIMVLIDGKEVITEEERRLKQDRERTKYWKVRSLQLCELLKKFLLTENSAGDHMW
jgi:hypothetical protein